VVITSQPASLAVTANVPSSAIHITLMIEAIFSSETSVFTRVIGRHIPEDDIDQGPVMEITNLKKN
jgi:hypothetical protein